ncbi:MAG: RluA family pseudouridine synthase [Candidatus Muiribacteriota bacterium]
MIIESKKKQKLIDFLFNSKMFSKKLIKSLIKENKILDLNNNKLNKNKILREGEKIFLQFEDEKYSDYVPIKYNLDILYEDDFFLIINKMPGTILFFTASNNKPCIASYVNYYYKKNNIKSKIRFVNRLDKDTTGILILAKNRFAHTWIFNNHQKTYVALTPKLIKKTGVVNAALIRKMPYTYVCERGKKAKTRYRTLKDYKYSSLVATKIYTGRTHQIRVHFKHLNHSLIADKAYGGMKHSQRKTFFLHCVRVKFIHPVSKKLIKVTADSV